MKKTLLATTALLITATFTAFANPIARADDIYVSNMNCVSSGESATSFTPSRRALVLANSGGQNVQSLPFYKSRNSYAAHFTESGLENLTPRGQWFVFACLFSTDDAGLAFDSGGHLRIGGCDDYASSLPWESSCGWSIREFDTGGQHTLRVAAALALDRSDDFYESGGDNGAAVMFGANGSNFVCASGLSNPDGRALDISDDSSVTDGMNRSSDTNQKFDSPRNRTRFAPGVNWLHGLVSGTTGNVYVTDYNGYGIEGPEPSGHDLVIAPCWSAPLGFDFDGNGNGHSAAHSSSDLIEKFDSVGHRTVFTLAVNRPYVLVFNTGGDLHVENRSHKTDEEDEPESHQVLFANPGKRTAPAAIPEPAVWAMLAMGIVVLGYSPRAETFRKGEAGQP